MKENALQLNQEKNLSLDRPEMVKEHNDLHAQWEKLDSHDRDLVMQGRGTQENTDMYNRKNELYEKVTNADKYKEMAKSSENMSEYKVGDVSDTEKIKIEKEKVDKEVTAMKLDIESTTQKLNFLRAKLDMPPTDEIPSLMDKKTKLEKLIAIQNNLESQLKFTEQKIESEKQVSVENKSLENNFLKNNLEETTSSLKKIAGMIDERMSQNYQGIFIDSSSFRSVASRIEDFSNMDDLKDALQKLGNLSTDFQRPSLNDNPDSMRELASKFKQLEASLRELPSKIQNEEERKEFGNLVYSTANKVDEAIGFIIRKAGQLEEARNF